MPHNIAIPYPCCDQAFYCRYALQRSFLSFYISSICHGSHVRPVTQTSRRFPCINCPAKWPVSHRNSCVWVVAWTGGLFPISRSFFLIPSHSSCTSQRKRKLHTVVNTCMCVCMWQENVILLLNNVLKDQNLCTYEITRTHIHIDIESAYNLQKLQRLNL